MAFADRFTGKDVYVEFTPDGGSLGQISGDQTEVTIDNTTDTADATAGSETDRSYIPTLTSREVGLTSFFGAEATYANIKERTEGVLTVYPKGKTSGQPMRSYNVIVTAFNVSYPFDDVAQLEATFQVSGTPIANVGDTYTP